MDPLSLSEQGGVAPGDAESFRAYLREPALAAPLALADVKLSDYDAVYLPGGHAPMADLARDADLGRLLDAADDGATPIAALCHGVAGLLSAGAANVDGWRFAGRAMTGLSDDEERAGGYGDRIPYLVETALRERGARIAPAAPWTEDVVVDGTLITGQNPQSSAATAHALVDRLRAVA